VHGFARTLARIDGLDPTALRFVHMIDAASVQLADLLDQLSDAARIEGRRFDPSLRRTSTLELARGAADRLGADTVFVTGDGGEVETEPETATRAVFNLARGALRHGGLERIDLRADGRVLALSPVPPEVAPILLGSELKDLGSAIACRTIAALGGSVEHQGETLVVRLPSG